MSDFKRNVLGLTIFAALLWVFMFGGKKHTEQEKLQAKSCQTTALQRDFGISYDEKHRVYTYHQDTQQEMHYIDFMLNCLPKDYPGTLDMKMRKIQLTEKIAIPK